MNVYTATLWPVCVCVRAHGAVFSRIDTAAKRGLTLYV